MAKPKIVFSNSNFIVRKREDWNDWNNQNEEFLNFVQRMMIDRGI